MTQSRYNNPTTNLFLNPTIFGVQTHKILKSHNMWAICQEGFIWKFSETLQFLQVPLTASKNDNSQQ